MPCTGAHLLDDEDVAVGLVQHGNAARIAAKLKAASDRHHDHEPAPRLDCDEE